MGVLAKINLGIFILLILPAIVYATHVESSPAPWSAKLPALFLQLLIYPFIALAAIGSLSSIIGLTEKKKKAVLSLVVHFLLLTIYILLASGKLIDFLVSLYHFLWA